jgi:hypothetical protein
MTNSDNRYFIRRDHEDDTVIPDSNSKVALPLARERFDITSPGFSIFGQRVEDSNSDFAVDGPQLSLCGLRPRSKAVLAQFLRPAGLGG